MNKYVRLWNWISRFLWRCSSYDKVKIVDWPWIQIFYYQDSTLECLIHGRKMLATDRCPTDSLVVILAIGFLLVFAYINRFK